MTRTLIAAVLAAGLVGRQAPPEVRFRAVDVQTNWGIVYAVRVVDVNADGRPDIVAINPTQLAWFENPSWQRHVILDNAVPKDHVTIAADDVDGDGQPEIALGAGWNPRDTTAGGELFLATRREPSGREPWAVRSLGSEPTLHRIRWATLAGKRALVVTALHGRGTSPPRWEGIGARIYALYPGADGSQTAKAETIDDTRHVLHNFLVTDFDRQPGDELVTASREGLTLFARRADGTWASQLLAESAPGEVALGRVGSRRIFATIEPWHGTAVVTYVEGASGWTRTVVHDGIAGGHAVAWADFDGDGNDELVAGWREGAHGLARHTIGADGRATARHMIDQAVAVEDLVVADLNGDRRPDIVGGGRSTGNIRIYFNDVAP